MNTARRATPDSEAVGSSEDERPWPSSTSFGSLPRKENSVPGLPGGIWSTQRKGSFKMSEAAHRNAAREIRVGAANPHSALRTANTPSPATSEGTGSLPFAIPLQPTPKAHRSLSHSQGQREAPQASATLPSAGSGASALPLGLLAEENDNDDDSDFGGQLTHTISHPPIGTLQRASTYSSAYGLQQGVGGHRGDFGNGQSGNRLAAAFSNNLSIDQPQRRSQWQTHLGWDDLSTINESRRHSLADIPTRRGSPAGDEHAPALNGNYGSRRPHTVGQQDNGATEMDPGLPTHSRMRFHDDGNGFDIPAMYRVPFVQILPEEHTEDDLRRERHGSTPTTQPWGGGARPRKQLFIVSFKCSRVDVFYLLDNTGLDIHEGDIVIVEADRGQDLGTVQHANVTPDQARLYKRKYAEEQYKWLMMFSRNNEPSNVNPNAQLYGESSATGGASRGNLLNNAPATMMGLPRENFNNLKPKAIKRLANSHEIKMLGEKEGNEAKAKRTCQQKVAHLHLQMEILDAEWQWDFQKLIFYYYADHYINFKDLITDLYRIYKTRIWLSAVNPASFSQHAMGQAPSGIGPGAITGGPNAGANTSYTMSYGQDPDPYGAVPPYRIGYETYTPNYPGIPGVSNSFAPPTIGALGASDVFVPATSFHSGAPIHYGNDNRSGQGPAHFQAVTDASNALPTVQPGASQAGMSSDYHYFYDRSGNNEHTMPFTPIETPVPSSTTSANPATALPFNPYTQQNYNSMHGGQAPPTGYLSPVSPWNDGSPSRPNTSGLGRQSELPQPIGTRPISNGIPQTPTSMSKYGETAEDSMRQYYSNPEAGNLDARFRNMALSSRSEPAQYHAAFANGARSGNLSEAYNQPPNRTQQRGNAFTAPVGKATEFNTWVQKLPDPKMEHNGEMSRER